MPIREAVSAGLARKERHDEDGCDPYWELTDSDLYGNFEWRDLKHIQRIDIDGGRYRTAAGIGRGASVSDLRRAYGPSLLPLGFGPERASGYASNLVLTTEAGSIIFNLDLEAGEPVSHSSVVTYMSVIPPATGREMVDMAIFQDSDPC